MKRHLSLVPFSRDHHGALILSRLLQKDAPAYKGLPADIPGKMAYALTFYQEHLLPHFTAEESCIVSHLQGKDTMLDQKLAEMVDEHSRLKEMFQSIPETDTPADWLDKTGRMLENHIRKEERDIFPLIEKIGDEEMLTRISVSLNALVHEKRY